MILCDLFFFSIERLIYLCSFREEIGFQTTVEVSKFCMFESHVFSLKKGIDGYAAKIPTTSCFI